MGKQVIQVGRSAVLTKGRRAGIKVKIAKILDKSFVEIELPGGKTRKCNVAHLEFY